MWDQSVFIRLFFQETPESKTGSGYCFFISFIVTKESFDWTHEKDGNSKTLQ